MEKIRIKCPYCSAVLEVDDNPAFVGKTLKCKNCGSKDKFENFKRIVPKAPAAEVETEVFRSSSPKSPGLLLNISDGHEYPLSEGVQTVGRKPKEGPAKADIAIVTSDKFMSRCHLRLEVMMGRDGFYHVYASNDGNKNPTYINGALLEDGDKVGVSHASTIRMGETTLRYVGTPTEIETEL